MAGIKRPLPESEDASADGVHPSRKRRFHVGEEQARLAQTYNDLAEDLAAVRLKAAGELLKSLAVEGADQAERVDAAITRLIKGLCSGRKAARVGFSIALAEVLRLAFDIGAKGAASGLDLQSLTDRSVKLTFVEGRGVSGQEKRNHLLGLRFALQALLRSDVALRKDVPDEQWRFLATAIADLAKQKEWLRTECGAMVCEYLESSEGGRMSDARVRAVLESWQEAGLLKTAEGVALWLAVTERWKDVLPKGTWHARDPLSSQELPTLRKIMMGSSVDDGGAGSGKRGPKSGQRQSQPSFAWKPILLNLQARGHPYVQLHNFWQQVVSSGLCGPSASAERKALGFQVAALAISIISHGGLEVILDQHLLRAVAVQRAESTRTLFEASKQVLDAACTRAKSEPKHCSKIAIPMLKYGVLDGQTKTKTLEIVCLAAPLDAMEETCSSLQSLEAQSLSETDQPDACRRAYADLAVTLLKQRKDRMRPESSKLAPWARHLLRLLVSVGYISSGSQVKPPVSDQTANFYRARLNSALAALSDSTAREMMAAFHGVLKELKESRATLRHPLTKDSLEALKSADRARKNATKKHQSDGDMTDTERAFDLLFDICMLQVYNQEPDSVEVLQDLQASFDNWQESKESASGLIELLLSFVSKPSALLRKLTEQVFAAFTGALHVDDLQSLLNILEQRESLSGQQELFQQHEEDGPANDVQADDDDEMIDVEDMSDVELINGEEASASSSHGDSEDDDDSASSSSATSGAEDEEDEATVFDRKLADALGTATADSDDDGSDMDDEQMMALEPHLTTIFKERKKATSSKQDNKDARENIVNFKNRVLDLLNIYVKAQYSNVLALDIILPLVSLMRTTTSKPTAEKALAVLRAYFESCTKHKSLPSPPETDAVFEVLEALMEEMKAGGSKLHANGCSRSSLFIAKVLVNLDAGNYERIAKMYAKLQSEWWMDPGSKVQGSAFTEWTSWSLTTRKQQK